jgi:predicted DCC family thiol-disulfide oxidoreductase YuxK
MIATGMARDPTHQMSDTDSPHSATDSPRSNLNPPQPAGWIVIYDGDCGFCRTALAAILSADRKHALRPLALGTPEADALLADMTPDRRDASWHLVSPDGHRESAGAAGPPLLKLLPGGKAPGAVLARFPNQTQRAYEWVADHRSGLSRLLPSGAKRRATQSIARRSA